MLVWKGWGFLVPIIVFGCLLGVAKATETIFNDERYYVANGWPKMTGMFIAAIPLWYFGRFLDAKGMRRLIDPETGEDVYIPPGHSFFNFPVHYWAPICVVLGILLAFVKE